MRIKLMLCNVLYLVTTIAVTTSEELIHINGKYLYFNGTKSLNYYQADLACKQLNMTLVTINSDVEHDNIVEHIKEKNYYGSFWIGGNDLAYEGDFYWADNGKRLTYTNWADDEPNNLPNGKETENCIVLHNLRGYYWDDVACKSRFYRFICEVIELNKYNF